MSKKQKNETSAKAPVKLTRAEKKEIQPSSESIRATASHIRRRPVIPYEAMYQDGVCRVTPRTFSKCIEFTDISYQLAQADTKTAIFENLCDLYKLSGRLHSCAVFLYQPQDRPQAVRQEL